MNAELGALFMTMYEMKDEAQIIATFEQFWPIMDHSKQGSYTKEELLAVCAAIDKKSNEEEIAQLPEDQRAAALADANAQAAAENQKIMTFITPNADGKIDKAAYAAGFAKRVLSEHQ